MKRQLRIGGSFGHKHDPVELRELVQFHGIVIRDGVKGQSDGAIHRRWDESSSSFDQDTAHGMTLTRFRQIKSVMPSTHAVSSSQNGSVEVEGMNESG